MQCGILHGILEQKNDIKGEIGKIFMKNRFQLLVMYQYFFLVLRYTMVVEDAKYRKKWVGVYVNSILSLQVFCKSKIILK